MVSLGCPNSALGKGGVLLPGVVQFSEIVGTLRLMSFWGSAHGQILICLCLPQAKVNELG